MGNKIRFTKLIKNFLFTNPYQGKIGEVKDGLAYMPPHLCTSETPLL